jgi:acyl-CoA thioesterase-1
MSVSAIMASLTDDGESGMDNWLRAGLEGVENHMAQFNRVTIATLLLAALVLAPAVAHAAPTTILAFGDSLFAGYGLGPGESIVDRLGEALRAAGHDVRMVNAGVSGDTTADGLARLDWSLAEKPDMALVEFGANDALRGLDPARAKENLDEILTRLRTAHVPALLIGMKAPRNLGAAYDEQFDAIYPALAEKFHVPLYPFILDGVALDPALNQPDNLHPNPKGVAVIVKRLTPVVQAALPK